MASGYLVNNACLVSLESATDAYFSGIPPSLASGSTVYFSMLQKDTAAWNLLNYQISPTGVYSLLNTTAMTAPVFPVCDPTERFFDGMQLGWGVAAAMIVVYVIRRVFR